MSEELFQLYSPEQVMIVTSPHFQSTTSATDNSTAALFNNPAEDFIIYSQDTNYTQSSDNGLFSNISHVIHQQPIVGDYVAVDSTFNSPHNSHIESPIIEDLCYTEIDQSILAQASPHGNSINNNPSLSFPTNNVFVSPQSPFTVATPVVGNDIILNSPIPLLGTPQQRQRLYNDINELIRTPGTHTVTTPIATPLTLWEPYYSDFSSLENTPILAPQTPATPYTPLQVGDPQLYDNNIGQDWYSLFPPFQYCAMPEITVEGEKKPEISEVTMGTPNSATSTSEKSPSLNVHEQTSELDHQLSSTIDTIDVKNSETKSPTHSSDSAHTTPANTPRLVPIRPRESGENSEPIRRSKRQRRSGFIFEACLFALLSVTDIGRSQNMKKKNVAMSLLTSSIGFPFI
ncbi:26784_t:CDS:2 [Dentiscutata erythropus]|uniref:26784_t:CDS:1 n=1 Tax=Dentiscutata erythropus TaxID=1348616 RepID=A0A9N9G2W7_9GLOM|nr:26784_t:CDS:2 [Dentiscutata erythropus]